MIRALYTAATGMQAQVTNTDVIANNIANVNTTGYKKSRAQFQDLLYQQVVEPGAPTSGGNASPSGIQVGMGVKTAAVDKIFVQGDLVNTGNPLDLAIEGEGFFSVTRPDGTTAFTRAGNLQLDQNGNMVTSDGYLLEPAIAIPAGTIAITISEDGTVSAKQAGQAAPQSVGQILPTRFANNGGLRAVGRNLFEETASSGAPEQGQFSNGAGFGRLQQGFLESSNVSVVDQVVTMITAQRAYEANSKGIQTADDMLNQAINIKR